MLVRRHRKLSAEERDEAWATRVEPAIRDYFEKRFVAQGLAPQRIEFVVLECRTSGCEIQAAGPPEDGGKPALDPQFLLNTMVVGPFAQDFEAGNILMFSTTLADGRRGILAFVSRKHP
jgi:hypothetical protein